MRLSGSGALQIARCIVDQITEGTATAQSCLFNIPPWRIRGTIYLFRGRKSYTGEDLIEFHLPGNPILCDRLIQECIQYGARLAEPGEFTARAYFNGKMDLTQAEGVAATIAALNERQLRAARQLHAGELARRIRPIMDLLAETLALVEAGIDFSDEDISFISAEELNGRIGRADQMLEQLESQSARFEPLGAEPTIALVGRPNAGKSTLINALAKSERAIVSPIAGTTRDALSAEVILEHGVVKIIDCPGIEELDEDNLIHRQMQEQARRAAQSADILVSVVESSDSLLPVDMDRPYDIHLRTKMDYGGEVAAGEIGVSALTGQGMDEFRSVLDQRAFGDLGGSATLTLNARHIQAISAAREALHLAQLQAVTGHEWIALHLREALDHIGQIVGTISPDELLGKVFSTFCIGK